MFALCAIKHLNGIRSGMRDEHATGVAMNVAMVELTGPIARWWRQIDIPVERKHATTPSQP